jgi:hypothetical protein
MRARLIVVFLVCVGFYVAWFAGVESWRQRRGPWEVTFRADAERNAVLELAQPRLNIRGVRIVVRGAALPEEFASRTVRFDAPGKRHGLPFGAVRFLDTTFLPGTVTLDILGHEIELLPRVLIVDKVEHLWRSGTRLELLASPR